MAHIGDEAGRLTDHKGTDFWAARKTRSKVRRFRDLGTSARDCQKMSKNKTDKPMLDKEKNLLQSVACFAEKQKTPSYSEGANPHANRQ